MTTKVAFFCASLLLNAALYVQSATDAEVDPLPACGVSVESRIRKIVGGDEAIPYSVPWMVSIRESGRHDCGGVLIKANWVLTTAKCVMQPSGGHKDMSHKSVIVGDHNLGVAEGTEREIGIAQVIIHHEFTVFGAPRANIALVKLERPVKITPLVNVICMPGKDEHLDGRRVRVSGWGQTLGTGNSQRLRQVVLPTVSDEACNKTYPKYFSLDHFCSGFVEGGKGPCQGDGGGPVSIQMDDGRWKLVGLTSWGIGCVLPGMFSVSTRVSYYLDWINVMSDDACHKNGTCCPATGADHYMVVPGTGCSQYLHGYRIIYRPLFCPAGTLFDTRVCVCNHRAVVQDRCFA